MEPRTRYACTSVTKEVSTDTWTHGCGLDRSCIMSEGCSITAPTLPELLSKVGERFGLDIDDVFIPGEGEDTFCFGYNRMENADGCEPSEEETRLWKKGRCVLYLADYSFTLELRTVAPVPLSTFAEAGIKTH